MNAALTVPFEPFFWRARAFDWRGLWKRAKRLMDDTAAIVQRKTMELAYKRQLAYRTLFLIDPMGPATSENIKPEARVALADMSRQYGLLTSQVRWGQGGVDQGATLYANGEADMVKRLWAMIGAKLPDIVEALRRQEEDDYL